MSAAEYGAVVQAIHEAYDATDNKSGLAGCLVRLAGHDFMDFRWSNIDGDGSTSSGGSDGCINFHDEDNTGLPQCIASFDLPSIY